MRPFAAGRELLPGIVVLEHLARSRRLDVYDAWSTERGCRVAVKVLRPDHRDNRRHVAALVREGRTLRRLTHPHVVRAFEVHVAPLAAVVLETLPGATLEALAEDEPLADAELRVLGAQLASGLHAIHAAGLLHLDLKPANVIVGAGRATLIDLSHARAPGRVPRGHGTWCFAAPEQVAGGAVGPATDAWGLGATLHAAATGRSVLADRADDLDVDDPQLHGPLPSLVDDRPDLSPELVATIDGWLCPDPAARPPADALLATPGAVRARPARRARAAA
jgi:serine/threonine protein kinase